MYDIAAVPPAGPPRPTHSDLFLAFLRITLSSIGGALPWIRRMVDCGGWSGGACRRRNLALRHRSMFVTVNGKGITP